MMTDPISDMLTRIRNAGRARRAETACPSSKIKLAIAELLQKEGFLKSVRTEMRGAHPALVLELRYDEEGRAVIDGIRRVSRPSRRVYVSAGDVPAVRNGLGVAVISTSKGILSDRDARSQGIGGEYVCEVW